jgi:hypothetical protein
MACRSALAVPVRYAEYTPAPDWLGCAPARVRTASDMVQAVVPTLPADTVIDPGDAAKYLMKIAVCE